MNSRFIYILHVAGFSFFLKLNNIPLCVHHIVFINSPADGHLGCVHIVAIVKSAAMNIGFGYAPVKTWSPHGI